MSKTHTHLNEFMDTLVSTVSLYTCSEHCISMIYHCISVCICWSFRNIEVHMQYNYAGRWQTMIYFFIYCHWVQKVLCKYTSSNDCSQTWPRVFQHSLWLSFLQSLERGHRTGARTSSFVNQVCWLTRDSAQQSDAFKGRLSSVYQHSPTGGRCLRCWESERFILQGRLGLFET